MPACLYSPLLPAESTQSSPLLGMEGCQPEEQTCRLVSTDHLHCLEQKKKCLDYRCGTFSFSHSCEQPSTELYTTPANSTCYVGQQALNTGWGGGKKILPSPHSRMAKTQTNVTDSNGGMCLDPQRR